MESAQEPGYPPGASFSNDRRPQPLKPTLGSSPFAPGGTARGSGANPLQVAYNAANNDHGELLTGEGYAVSGGQLPVVNLGSGYSIRQVAIPGSGTFSANASLAQNSHPGPSNGPSPGFGNGGFGNFGQNAQPPNTENCVYIVCSTGNAEHSEGAGGTDPFQANPSNVSGLKEGSLVQTFWDGTRLKFDFTTGSLLSVQPRTRTASAMLYTVTQDTRSPRRVVDPFGRITTYTYGGSNQLRRIQDYAGRITTFTTALAGADYNITGTTSPVGQRTTMTFVSAGVLNYQAIESIATPDANRTTYSYEGRGRVGQIVSPLNYRTTFAYSDDTLARISTRVRDPRGNITTFLVDHAMDGASEGSIAGVINPLLNRFTYSWDNQRLMSAEDVNGRTDFTYVALDTFGGTLALESVRKQASGIFTYVYDVDDQITALINQKNDRTTLVWDSDGFRTAVINAKLLRTSYAYNDRGQITAIIDPLLRRTTYVYDAYAELSATVNPALERTSYVYNAYGQKAATINPLLNRTTQVLDEMNRVTADVDANDFRTTYTYDAMGWRVGTLNALLDRSTQVYDVEGRIIADVNTAGARTSYTFDSNSNRTSVLDPLLRRTTYVYDAANQMVATINPLLERTSYAYDEAGNRVATIDALLNRTTTVYDADRRIVGVINGLDERSTIVYDGLGSQIATIDALDHRFTSVYDSLARRIATITPLLDRTTFIYDDGNQLTATIDAQLARTSYAYDLAGRRIRVQDALGNITTTVYDAAGEPIATVDPLLDRTTFAYDSDGRLLRTTNALGYTSTNVYDALGRQIAAINPLEYRTSFVYDTAGNQIRTEDPNGNITTVVYNLADHPIAQINPLLDRTTFIYDAIGRQVATQDAELNRTTSVFDAAGRQVAQIDGNGYRTTTVYDAANRRIAIEDANQHRTSFACDATGHVLLQTDALDRRITFTYDADGRVASRIDARGVITTYVYDSLSQLTERKYSDGTRVTFAYDALGNRTKMRDPSGLYTYTYDALSRLTEQVFRTYSVRMTYTYDAIGQPRSLRSPAGRFTYTFDAAGQNVGLSSPLTTWTYDPAGRTVAKFNVNDTSVTYVYDAADRITEFQQSIPDYPYTQTVTYDKVGNRTVIIDPVFTGAATYTYDQAYQLTSNIHGNWEPLATYVYDPVGNRQVLKRADGTRVTYAYDDANQMNRFNDNAALTTFTYDASGNPLTQINTSEPRRVTFTWDAENRLASFQQTAPSVNDSITHLYNGDGLRAERGGSSLAFARYVWDGQNVHLRLNASNSLVDGYAYEPRLYGNLVASVAYPMRINVYDPLGSTEWSTTDDGGLNAEYRYNAWGDFRVNSPNYSLAPDSFLYRARVGYYSDDDLFDKHHLSSTLPVYVRNRFYQPLWGRWLNPDPLRNMADWLNAGNNELIGRSSSVWLPIFRDLYQYVGNNPINYNDPSGLAVFLAPSGSHCAGPPPCCLVKTTPSCGVGIGPQCAIYAGCAAAGVGAKLIYDWWCDKPPKMDPMCHCYCYSATLDNYLYIGFVKVAACNALLNPCKCGDDPNNPPKPWGRK